MKRYELTLDAEQDLREVARYTLNKWGKDKFHIYRKGLKETFERIGKHEIKRRAFSGKYPGLCVAKYQQHYIFYLIETAGEPLIIGVIHHRRDIVSRLAERLS